ncbi:MAG: hypothetical protein ACYTHJ_00965 [Planctomycetota bacterium]|jgi:hypothetical protein
MKRFSNVRGLRLWCVVVFALTAARVQAAVNLEFRPASQTVTNNTIANIEVYAVSDNASNQDVGLVQVVFSWDENVLELVGVDNNGPYNWFTLGFPNNVVNAPLQGGLPLNDGDGALVALAQFDPNPVAQATPAGLLVGTLKFQAIDTGTDSIISILPLLSGVDTVVFDIPAGETQMDVTGTLGPDVTVTSICNNNLDCDDSNDCTTDTCNGQVCSHTNLSAGTACGSVLNNDCDNPDTCDGNGTCLDNFEASGTACGSPVNSDCDNPDTCNGAGECLTNFEPEGLACGSTSNTECDNPDTCNASGVCLTNFESSGTPCGDPSVTECDNPDQCDGTGACDPNYESAGTNCGDFTDNACTDPDTCNGNGACDPNDFSACLPPTPFCIDDGNGMPLCVECLFGDNAPCEDSNPCTSDFCDLTNVCRNSPDPNNGLSCEDSLFCNGAEVCSDGACVVLSDACDDENPCTDDACNEISDTCTNTPDDSNNPDDGLFCNGVDFCVDGEIQIGEIPDCDDINVCTDDSCDDVLGCVHLPNLSDCEDGDPCTVDDSCGGGVCVPGPPPMGNGEVNLVWIPSNATVQVGDNVILELHAFSVDAFPDEIFSVDVVLNWDPSLIGLVGNINDGHNWLLSFFPAEADLNLTFDDGNAVYSALSQLGAPAVATQSGLHIVSIEFSTAGLDAGTQIQIVPCDGPNGTITRVDGGVAGQLQGDLGAATVSIVECFTSEGCDDGIFCNGAEVCSGNSCGPGLEPCDDNNICTDDICSEAAQACQTIPLTQDADQDGIYCNGVDRCEAGVFVPGTPIQCGDGNPCTDEFCDEDIDSCVVNNNSNACNDQDLCTEDDVCDNGVCAGVQIPFCQDCLFDSECDDGVSCTIDDCDDVDQVCRFIPDNGACIDDGLICNGPEVCLGIDGDPVTGCGSAGPPCENCVEGIGCDCEPPIVNAVSSRYIEVIPAANDAPIAFIVETCAGQQYAGAWPGEGGPLPIDLTQDGSIDGTVALLVDDPADALYLTPAEWGFVVWIGGIHIGPADTFLVLGDCGSPGDPSLTASTEVTTWNFGDVDNNGLASLADALFTIQAFQAFFVEGNTRIRADIAGCQPDMVHSLSDTLSAILAFQQVPFFLTCPESECP